jgi:integrase/recombinase XerD
MGYSVHRVNLNLSSSLLDRERHAVSLIYDSQGLRKYLTIAERAAFLAAASEMPGEIRTFATMLAYTGARLSEVLSLTRGQVDMTAGVVVFESLKKRRRNVYRAVPVPHELLVELELIHGLAATRQVPGAASMRLWPWGRTTGWTRVKEVMAKGGVVGPQASAKGLRHGFAVAALQAGVPINFVRRWLGHSRLSTTEIYADAVGAEERAIAARFWETF